MRVQRKMKVKWSNKAERLRKQQRQNDESSEKNAGEWSDKAERL